MSTVDHAEHDLPGSPQEVDHADHDLPGSPQEENESEVLQELVNVCEHLKQMRMLEDEEDNSSMEDELGKIMEEAFGGRVPLETLEKLLLKCKEIEYEREHVQMEAAIEEMEKKSAVTHKYHITKLMQNAFEVSKYEDSLGKMRREQVNATIMFYVPSKKDLINAKYVLRVEKAEGAQHDLIAIAPVTECSIMSATNENGDMALRFSMPAVMGFEHSIWDITWILSKNAHRRFKKIYSKWLQNYKIKT